MLKLSPVMFRFYGINLCYASAEIDYITGTTCQIFQNQFIVCDKSVRLYGSYLLIGGRILRGRKRIGGYGGDFVAGFIQSDDFHAVFRIRPQGAVYRVDTASLKVEAKVTVGYQPDELTVLGEYLYVANSGGYRAPDYDNTVSVIELERFKQVQKIPVGINLHRIRADKYGKLWVTSRGDYNTIHSNLYVLEKRPGYTEMVVTDTLNIPCSNLWIDDDCLYYYSTEWNNNTQSNTIGYGVIDIRTKKVIRDSFISDGTEKDIKIPYGIAVHPVTKDIYVTDAKNYVSSGTLYCYDQDGFQKWGVRTGDIPAHMVFVNKEE